MKIVLTGSLSIDQIMNFDGKFEDMIQPNKLHVLSISVLLKELKRTRGGIAANIAYSLALLGEKPILFGSIGQESRDYMDDLAQLGIDTTKVHYSELPTASFSVITDANDCQVGGFYPGAMGDASSLSINEFAKTDAVIVISAHDPQQMGVQIAECAQLQKRTCFDVGQQVIALKPEVLMQGVEAAELMILNDYELGILCDRITLSQQEVVDAVQTVVVTLGEKGAALYFRGKKTAEIPAVTVKNVIDPTGAGDAFRAGFLYGYIRDWDAVDCVQLGAAVASFAIEKHGTQEHFFDLEEVAKRHQQAYGKTSPLELLMKTATV